MPQPIRFAFGLHLHQPVGNFDSVFAQHVAEVYRPLLERLEERDFLPLSLHLSGPLLEWLERHDRPYLDHLGRLAADGRVELLLAGLYEPVLVALPRRDRVEQVQWMRDALHRRFGVQATGLWLTERVWEPDLAEDLAQAGVRYALVDDRHFLVAGFRRDQLHTPWLTESDGRRLALFPIDERLRYLIPFRPPSETAAYLRRLASEGHRLAVLADDGEKFGGWPGTREWVYEQGWLDQFLTTMAALVDGGEVILTALDSALGAVPPAGLAYLPTASYREMEGWSLPADAARRLATLEAELGEERLAGPDGALVRGTHWRNFLVKYPESNRMQKKMVALSTLCREAGDPPEARHAVARAQCNDAYWHGVFGGLYLPHLREAIWAELAHAEGVLRQGQAAGWDRLDLDYDGRDELWLHDATYSALVAPSRGAAIEEYTVFGHRRNYVNILSRRREAYHQVAPADQQVGHHDASGAPSIHDLEHRMRLNELPPLDPEPRALINERVLTPEIQEPMYRRGDFDPAWSLRSFHLEPELARDDGSLVLTARVTDAGIVIFEKVYRFVSGGGLHAEYRWRPAAFPPGAVFAPEISFAGPLEIRCEPGVEVWSYDICTVSKSERDLEQTVQGRAVTPRWPVELAAAKIELWPGGG